MPGHGDVNAHSTQPTREACAMLHTTSHVAPVRQRRTVALCAANPLQLCPALCRYGLPALPIAHTPSASMSRAPPSCIPPLEARHLNLATLCHVLHSILASTLHCCSPPGQHCRQVAHLHAAPLLLACFRPSETRRARFVDQSRCGAHESQRHLINHMASQIAAASGTSSCSNVPGCYASE